MKKATKLKLIGIGAVLLAFGALIIIASFQENKLQATLSDGTIIKIEKVEVTKEPHYDPRSLSQQFAGWLYGRKWGRSILKALKFDLANDGGVFGTRTRQNDVFQVWYSLSNPEKGFFPEMVKNINTYGSVAGSSETNFFPDQIRLIDEDGCIYSEGQKGAAFHKFGTTDLLAYSFTFENFNSAAKTLQLVVKFPQEKQPLTFVLKNPDSRKAPSASPLAASLPVKQSIGKTSIILHSLRRRGKEWKPEFHFEREGIEANKDYTTMEVELGDSQGGGKGFVCAKANEWIIKGFVRAQRLKAIDSEKRFLVENLSRPQPQEYLPVALPAEAQKFLLGVYLVGAGTYVLDENGIISTGGVGDLEKQHGLFEKVPRPRMANSTRQTYSDSYWNEQQKKSFYWEQKIFGETTPALFLLTDKPALLFRAAPFNTEHSALLLSNSALKWDFCEKDFSGSRWGAMPLDWKEGDGPQSLEIGYAGAMPFELHILPAEEMRQLVQSYSRSKK